MSTTNIVWLTGGSSGIGAHLCEELLNEGAEVVNFARRTPPIEHARLHHLSVDLTDSEATLEAAHEAGKHWPGTRLVHNAGAIREKPLGEVLPEDLEALSALHVGSAITLVQQMLPHMRAERQGRIVLVSTRAVLGLEKRTVYSATKAGMIGMGRTWALELAPYGVTVNMVAPGPIADTEMFDQVVQPGSELAKRVAERVPLGRIGRPSDVSRAVLFFLSGKAGFVTGQTLFVCGGASLGGMHFN